MLHFILNMRALHLANIHLFLGTALIILFLDNQLITQIEFHIENHHNCIMNMFCRVSMSRVQ